MRKLAILAALALIPACGGGGGGGGGGDAISTVSDSASTVTVVGKGSLPAGLPARFGLGLASNPTELGWMSTSGVPWDYRSQYLSGGVNSGAGWSTWNAPAGQFAASYMTASAAAGKIPVFVYYQFVGSTPDASDEDPDTKLNNTATMAAYYADFKLLMQKCGGFGGTVIVLVEPDFWGHCQNEHGANPASVTVKTTSSGFAEAVGTEDLRGFAQTLVALRNSYAANALLAWHASHWAAGPDLIINAVDPVAQADATAAYYTALGAAFQLLSHDPSDRDSQYKVVQYGASIADAWWDAADFERYRAYLDRMHDVTNLRGFLFQVPAGNTVCRSCDNSWGHYQDNRPEFFLQEGNRANREAFAAAGVFAVIFAGAGGGTTSYRDAQGDGLTSPGPVNGNTAAPATADDDGGFLRLRAGAYYLGVQTLN